MPTKEFERLLQYLQKAEKAISDDLAKTIVIQFIFKKTLYNEGKKFFGAIKKKEISEFINNMEDRKYDEVWIFLKEDLGFAVAMANMAKEYPDLRRKIIEKLPIDGSIQKEKLLLLLNYDEKNINEAFNLLKIIDLSKISYFECRPFLEIAQEKKAWDFVIEILEKLLQYEKDKRVLLHLKLQLFTANFNLGKYPEVIQIGETILHDCEEMRLLNDKNKESLLGQTILARMKRGEYVEAKVLIDKYQIYCKTFEFKVGVETEVYIKSNDAHKAIASLVAGVINAKTPTPEQYGSLFIYFTEICNLIDFPLSSLDKIEGNCFVKFKNQERWYFVGEHNELDATKISLTSKIYSILINRKIGEKVIFDDKYRLNKTEQTIEHILPIEKYIYWQCIHHAQQLSLENRWDMMEVIDVPTTGETIDTKYIIARLEDEQIKRGELFTLYCRENLPLAYLAINEGGLTNAIGCIVNENKGFIKFSSGDLAEMNQQKEVAKKIIAGEPFYIDGTSALVLTETGLLEIIYKYIINMKVPQSVINLLLETKEKTVYAPGQVGHMGYAQGKLRISTIDKEKRDSVHNSIEKSTNIFESNRNNIVAISSANKANCFSNKKFLQNYVMRVFWPKKIRFMCSLKIIYT